jgi:hypothetical protein
MNLADKQHQNHEPPPVIPIHFLLDSSNAEADNQLGIASPKSSCLSQRTTP